MTELEYALEADLMAVPLEEIASHNTQRTRWKQGYKTGIKQERIRVLNILQSDVLQGAPHCACVRCAHVKDVMNQIKEG